MTGIDWAGLSARKVRGWFRGSHCLARCDESHRGGRWCLTDRRTPMLRRLKRAYCSIVSHTGGRPLGAMFLCGRCGSIVDIRTGRRPR